MAKEESSSGNVLFFMFVIAVILFFVWANKEKIESDFDNQVQDKLLKNEVRQND